MTHSMSVAGYSARTRQHECRCAGQAFRMDLAHTWVGCGGRVTQPQRAEAARLTWLQARRAAPAGALVRRPALPRREPLVRRQLGQARRHRQRGRQRGCPSLVRAARCSALIAAAGGPVHLSTGPLPPGGGCSMVAGAAAGCQPLQRCRLLLPVLLIAAPPVSIQAIGSRLGSCFEGCIACGCHRWTVLLLKSHRELGKFPAILWPCYSLFGFHTCIRDTAMGPSPVLSVPDQ